MGTITRVEPSPASRGKGLVRLEINPGSWKHAPALGDSIAVSGCCLTLAHFAKNPRMRARGWGFDVIPQTLAVTTLGGLKAGDRVNLEHALRADGLLGGHMVQGHVDGVGRVLKVTSGDDWRARVQVPSHVAACMIPQGSITIDGVSLTIAAVGAARGETAIEVALIPETLARTTLVDRRAGDLVNIEADMIAKTVVNVLAHREGARLATPARKAKNPARRRGRS